MSWKLSDGVTGRFFTSMASLLALMAITGCGPREAGVAASLQVNDGWVRAAPPGARMTAAYGKLDNSGSEPLAVVAWSSPGWRDVSLHRTVADGDMRRMEAVERLEVPAEGAVTLEPGGLHLMLMGPLEARPEGSTVRIEARREDGSANTLEFVVVRR